MTELLKAKYMPSASELTQLPNHNIYEMVQGALDVLSPLSDLHKMMITCTYR